MKSLPLPLNQHPYSSIPAGADPLDLSTYVFKEDFTHCGNINQVNASLAIPFEHGWAVTNIGANANCKVVFANPNDGIHIGAVGLNANNTGTGNGAVLFLGGGTFSVGFINPNTTTFVYKTALQLSTISNIGVFIGLCSNNAQSVVPNVNTAIFCGIRYDTALSDANLFFVGQTNSAHGNTWQDTGVPATTGWHNLVMRGYANGSVTFQLDGNSTVATISTIPSASMDFGQVMLVTRTTGAPQLNVDYVVLEVPGLNR